MGKLSETLGPFLGVTQTRSDLDGGDDGDQDPDTEVKIQINVVVEGKMQEFIEACVRLTESDNKTDS